MHTLLRREKCWEEAEIQVSATLVVPCKKTCSASKEESKSRILSTILPSFAAFCMRPTAKEKKVLLPSATKDAKIDTPVEDSSACTLATRHDLPSMLTDPVKS